MTVQVMLTAGQSVRMAQLATGGQQEHALNTEVDTADGTQLLKLFWFGCITGGEGGLHGITCHECLLASVKELQ